MQSGSPAARGHGPGGRRSEPRACAAPVLRAIIGVSLHHRRHVFRCLCLQHRPLLPTRLPPTRPFTASCVAARPAIAGVASANSPATAFTPNSTLPRFAAPAAKARGMVRCAACAMPAVNGCAGWRFPRPTRLTTRHHPRPCPAQLPTLHADVRPNRGAPEKRLLLRPVHRESVLPECDRGHGYPPRPLRAARRQPAWR